MLGAWVGFCEFAVEVICNDDSTQMSLGVGRLNVVESMSFDGFVDGRAVRRSGRACESSGRSRVRDGRDGDGSQYPVDFSLPF